MARQVVLLGSESQRPGVFIVDAPAGEARERVLAGEGQAIWTLRMGAPNSELLRSLSPAAQDAAHKHIGDLGRVFGESDVVREFQRQTGQQPGILNRALGLGQQAAPSIVVEEIAGQSVRALGRATKNPALMAAEMPARSLGAMIGEGIRQIFLSPESEPIDLLEILAAGAIPAKGKVAKQIADSLGIPTRTALSQRQARIRFTKRLVPGGGVALLDEAREEILNVSETIRRDADDIVKASFPGKTAGQLRQDSLQMNPIIRTPNLNIAARELLDDEGLAAFFGAELGGRAARIAKKGGAIREATLQQLNVLRRNLGGLISSARTAGNQVVEERFRGLFAALMRDLEVARVLKVPGASEYLTSLESWRRQYAADAWDDIVQTRFSRPVRGEEFESLNITNLARDFKRSLTAEKATRPRGFTNLPDLLTAAEKQEITELLEFWNESLPALPRRMGINQAPVGSGQLVSLGGLAVVLNKAAGSPVSHFVAFSGGAAVSALVSNMMMSPKGRRLLRAFITEGGPINLTEMAIRWIGQGGRAEIFNRLQNVNQRLQAPLVTPRFEAVR